MQRSLREITDANPEKIMSPENLEKVKKFIQAHHIRQAYVGVPSPLDEESPLQIACALTIPITLAYEYMFTAPKEHVFWRYLSQIPASCRVAVPTREAEEDLVKQRFHNKSHVVGHLSIDRAFSPQAGVNVKAIQEKLMVSENQDLAFISGTTQPTTVDCHFLEALLSTLNTGEYKNIQVRFGIHPGVKDLDVYIGELLTICEKYSQLKDQVKIILPSSIESKLSRSVQSDFILRADVSGAEASRVANRVAQAVPGALINESALQGMPVYFHDQTALPYLPKALFSENIPAFFAAKPRPCSIPKELDLSAEGSAPMRMAQVLVG